MLRDEALRLAKLLEDTTYEGLRDGLVKDLRAGVYRENGKLRMPFEALSVALNIMEAPDEVVACAAEIRAASEKRAAPITIPDEDSPELLAALAALYPNGTPFALPDVDVEDMLEAHAEEMLPAGEFRRALFAQNVAENEHLAEIYATQQ